MFILLFDYLLLHFACSKVGGELVDNGLVAYLLVYHVADTMQKLLLIAACIATSNTAERCTEHRYGLLKFLLLLAFLFSVRELLVSGNKHLVHIFAPFFSRQSIHSFGCTFHTNICSITPLLISKMLTLRSLENRKPSKFMNKPVLQSFHNRSSFM